MKLKILVKIVEKLLGMTDNGDEPRADMFLTASELITLRTCSCRASIGSCTFLQRLSV